MESRTVVCVGAVVRRDGKLLAIRQAKGHPLEGQWTIPWGRLEEGESPAAAAIRETSEEAGIVASVDGLLGIQDLPDPQSGWIALVFLCSHVSGTPVPDYRETDAASYLSLEDIDSLAEPIEPWSEWMLRRVLKGGWTLTAPSDGNPYSPKNGFI